MAFLSRHLGTPADNALVLRCGALAFVNQGLVGEGREMDEQDYKEYLNEVYGDIDICGLSYPAGQVLQDVDPTAFDVGFADWSSEQEE